MASGSHVYSGICADLPIAPTNNARVISVMAVPPIVNARGACSNTSMNDSVPTAWKIMNIASRNPTSPMRFMMKAFLPALAKASFSNQNPISR